jgi:ubiquinone/menaquinone biosynthesis C-methylase UbiE
MPGRWKQVAELLIKNYNLTNNSSVLDVGCGKGFLLYEMKLLLPNLKISGFDISKHGIEHAKEEIKKYLFIHRAQKPYPFKNKEFDLVISLGCLHNLKVFELEIALKEIERVGKQGYIMLESYRSEKELFNLQCWALTCESFFNHKEWVWIYNHFGYTGDYEFIYFE